MTAAEFDGEDTLACSTLRFDGREYKKRSGFDYHKSIERFFQSGQGDILGAEQLAMLSFLYQPLVEVGLRVEPKGSEYWRRFARCVCWLPNANFSKSTSGNGRWKNGTGNTLPDWLKASNVFDGFTKTPRMLSCDGNTAG